jgi:RimJ/RimL family protein N-acetyltransferase
VSGASAARRAGSAALVRARRTTETDLAFVLAAESHPENAPWVKQWTRTEHAWAVSDPTMAHWVLESRGTGAAVGFVILAGLSKETPEVELKRLVVLEKGRGFGRAAVGLVKRYAFEELGAARLWLDVYEHNERARALYHAQGFRTEGVVRDHAEVDGRRVSLHILSILAGEYQP